MNHELDNRIHRESSQIRKKSITVQSEKIFQAALNENAVQGEIPEFIEANQFRESVKCDAKARARSELQEAHSD